MGFFSVNLWHQKCFKLASRQPLPSSGICPLYSFARAAMRKYHKLGDLFKQQTFISSQSQRPEVWHHVMTESVPLEACEQRICPRSPSFTSGWLSSSCVFVLKWGGAGHNFWKDDIVQGDNINWLESNGSKMADKSTLTRSWSSVYAHCNTSAS